MSKNKKKAAQKRQQARTNRRRTIVLGTLIAALGVAALMFLTVPNTKFDLTAQPIVGQANAPHTLVMFGDLKCPACRDFEKYSQGIVETARQKGQLKTVFLHFPFLSRNAKLSEDDSRLMARAAECAFLTDGAAAHERVIQELYARQGPEDLAWGGKDTLGGLLEQAGFTQEQAQKLSRCAQDDPRAEQAVQRDEALARQAKISSTPSLFLDGKTYVNQQKLMQAISDFQ